MKRLHPDKVKGSSSRDFKLLLNISFIIKEFNALEENLRYLGSHFILLSKRVFLLSGQTVFRYAVTVLD